MTSSQPPAPSTAATTAGAPRTQDSPPIRGAGWASLLQGLLIFVPIAILGSAINWPSSLSDPASTMLPRIAENEGAVRLGYLAYLAYSVLFGITVVLLARLVEGHLPAGARRLLVGFAIASVAARCLGIVRWLAPMPVLADSYVETEDETQRYAVEQVYGAVNAWGGTIGEALGVGLFAAIALGMLAAGMLKARQIPRWIAVWAMIAAAAVLVNAVELFGTDIGPLSTVTVTVVQLWFVATGIWLLTRGRRLSA